MQGVLPYFSFQGRANRQRFWVTTLTIFVLYFLGALIFGALARIPVVGIFAGLVLIVVVLAALVAVLANSTRRLHDRGKSAWWLLLFQGAPLLIGLFEAIARVGSGPGNEAAGSALAVLSLPISIWAFIELGCLRGATGPNRFGEDPLASPLQEVFA